MGGSAVFKHLEEEGHLMTGMAGSRGQVEEETRRGAPAYAFEFEAAGRGEGTSKDRRLERSW